MKERSGVWARWWILSIGAEGERSTDTIVYSLMLLRYGTMLCVTQIGRRANLPVCVEANSWSAPLFSKNGYETVATIKVLDQRPDQEASVELYILLYTPPRTEDENISRSMEYAERML